MRIAVCGEYYSSNLGDPIIVESMVYMTKQIYPNADIKIIDLDARNKIKNRKIKLQYNNINNKKNIIKKPVLLKSLKGLIKWIIKDKKRVKSYFKNELSNIDLLIIAGGQLLMNNNLNFPLRLNLLINQAEKNGIPVIFNSCGVQNYKKNSYGKYLISKTLNNKYVKVATTRDDIDMLRSYIKDNNKIVEKNVDVAVWCNKAYSIEKVDNSNVIGLGVIAHVAYEKYYERTTDKSYYITEEELYSFWMNIIELFNREGIEWKIFCNGSEQDYEFGYILLKRLGYSDTELNNKIVQRPTEPVELVKQISEFKTIISHRLHSHIVAFSLGIPIIGLIWDKKTLDFAEMIGIQENFINIKLSSPEEIYGKYKKIQENVFIDNSNIYRVKAMKYVEYMKKYIKK